MNIQNLNRLFVLVPLTMFMRCNICSILTKHMAMWWAFQSAMANNNYPLQWLIPSLMLDVVHANWWWGGGIATMICFLLQPLLSVEKMVYVYGGALMIVSPRLGFDVCLAIWCLTCGGDGMNQRPVPLGLSLGLRLLERSTLW